MQALVAAVVWGDWCSSSTLNLHNTYSPSDTLFTIFDLSFLKQLVRFLFYAINDVQTLPPYVIAVSLLTP